MNAPEPLCPPSWRDFLSFVEDLLAQPNIKAQVEQIKSYIHQKFDFEVDIWLAEPFFPLPEEPDLLTMQTAQPPELVRRVLVSRVTERTCPGDDGCIESAIPMITSADLLGVIYIHATPDHLLSAVTLDHLEGLGANAAVALQITRQISLKNFRSHQLDLVRQVSDQIANIGDIDLLCRHVTQLIQSTFNYYYVSIFTLEPGSNDLRFRASASDSPGRTENLAFPVKLGEGIVGKAAASGGEIIAQDVRKESSFRFIDILPETLSEAAVPMHSEKGVLGVLDVQSDNLNGFHEVDLLVLRSLAAQVALAIEGAQLQTDQQDKASKLELLFDISHIITSILDFKELSENIVSLIQQRLGYSFVEYYSYHPGRKKLFYEFGSGPRSKYLAEMDIAYDLDDPMGIIPWVARNNQRRLVRDVSQEPLYRPSELTPEATRSELAMPIIYGGELQGILDLQSEELDAFSEDDLQILESLAASVAIAMRNATLYRSELWRSNVAERMRGITRLLSQNPDPQHVMTFILQAIESSLPLDAAAIWLVDTDADSGSIKPSDLKLGASFGVSEEQLQKVKLSNPDVDEWMNLINGSPDASIREKGGLYGPLGLALDFQADYSSVAAPMYAGTQPLGLLTIAHHTPSRYGYEALSMTQTYANYAAVAIENARLFQDAQQNAWMSRTLLNVSDLSRTAESVSELLSTIASITPKLIGVEKCDLILWDEEVQQFMLKASSQEDANLRDQPQDKGAGSALEQLIETRSMVYVDEQGQPINNGTGDTPAGARGIMAPLLLHTEIIGAMRVAFVDTPQHKAYQHRLAILVQGIANHTAVGLENLKLSEAQAEDAYINAALLQLAQAVVSQKSYQEILTTITHLTPILTGVGTCVIYTWDASRNGFTVADAFTGSHEDEAIIKNQFILPDDFALLNAVRDSGALHFVKLPDSKTAHEGWRELTPHSAIDLDRSKVSPGDSLLFGFPLASHGEFYGVMLLSDSYQTLQLLQKRLELFNGIVQQTAMAIQNEYLNRELVLRERRGREMQLARQIQKTFLPSVLPQFPGWELDASWQTALQVGGDFYDVIDLGPDQLGLVIADVADKGMPAAMFMTVARTLIQAIAPSTTSPARLLQSVNRLLYSEQDNAMYVTVFYARVDLKSGTVIYANAGHNPPLLARANHEVQEVQGSGIALGVLDDAKYEDHLIELASGDALLLYTDGIPETVAPDGELYGMEPFEALLRTHGGLPVKELLETINAAVIEYRQNLPPSDDVTMLCIRRS